MASCGFGPALRNFTRLGDEPALTAQKSSTAGVAPASGSMATSTQCFEPVPASNAITPVGRTSLMSLSSPTSTPPARAVGASAGLSRASAGARSRSPHAVPLPERVAYVDATGGGDEVLTPVTVLTVRPPET